MTLPRRLRYVTCLIITNLKNLLQFLKSKKCGLGTVVAIRPGKVVDAADLNFDSDSDDESEVFLK